MKRIILILIFLIGCVSDGVNYKYIRFTAPVSLAEVEIPIWIDKSFSGIDKRSLEESIAEWNYVLNGHVRLRIVSEDFDMSPEEIELANKMNGWLILKIDSKNDRVSGNNWLAFCDRVSGHYMYIIRDRMGDRDIKQISLHEMGHLLGSEHVGHHLMYKYYKYDRYSCVDREVAEEVAIRWNLTIDKLNYCVPITDP